MRSGSWSRSLRYSNSPDTSMTMRVTSETDQWRTAVTEWIAAWSGMSQAATESASEASRFIVPWSLLRDVTHGPIGLMDLHDARRFGRSRFRRNRRSWFRRHCTHLLADLNEVLLGLWEGWNAPILRHSLLAGIVSSQRQWIIAMVQIEKVAQILGAAFQIFHRIPDIDHAKPSGCSRNQLHQ